MPVLSYPADQIPTERLLGEIDIRANPCVHLARDVYFLPAENGLYSGGWGLFDTAGRAVPYSIPYRGAGERPFKHLDGLELVPQAAKLPGRYFYLGQIQLHYGHFLIEGLNRMWSFQDWRDKVDGVLYHGELPPKAMLERFEFIRVCLDALGIAADRLFRPSTACRVEELVIPQAAMQPRGHVYKEFKGIFGVISHHLASAAAKHEAAWHPVYISKTRIETGITKAVNEDELEQTFRQRGIEIIHPEQLAFAEQINRFERDRFFIGFAGSAFHTCLFGTCGKRLR